MHTQFESFIQNPTHSSVTRLHQINQLNNSNECVQQIRFTINTVVLSNLYWTPELIHTYAVYICSCFSAIYEWMSIHCCSYFPFKERRVSDTLDNTNIVLIAERTRDIRTMIKLKRIKGQNSEKNKKTQGKI